MSQPKSPPQAPHDGSPGSPPNPAAGPDPRSQARPSGRPDSRGEKGGNGAQTARPTASAGAGSGSGDAPYDRIEAARMGFFEHLDELRARLVRSVAVFFVGFVICYFFAEPILAVLRKPLFNALPPEGRKLYFTSLFENFMTHLKIGGYASIFAFSPYFFYELWGFVSPGLYPRERKLVVPFVSAASFFFIGGACFAYFVLFPVGFKYFVTYGGPADVPLLTIDAYYSTVLKLLLLFGLAFELPVLVCLLGFLGLVDAPLLRQHRRTAILGITILSALFAPPDAVSMLILGAPLIVLFEGSIWVVHWFGLKRPAPVAPLPDETTFLSGRSR